MTPSRAPRNRRPRNRTLPRVERLEPRLLLAADSGSAVREIAWNGGLVMARADAWIVRADNAAVPVRPGWSTASLGDGFVSLRAPAASVADVRGWAAATPGVRYVEPDFVITGSATPNDPSYSRLWGLHNTGQTGGVFDADMDVAEAWDTTTGSRSVVVGVIDTGIDYRHPDLAANIWRNPGEVAGDGIDNDRNGYVDDVHGWDFANNDADPFDDAGHGTHVAGTIGAVGNNGVGVTGVAWNVSLMALKFLGADGSGSTSGAIAAINYATRMRQSFGVNVVATNNSWGGGGFSTALRDAIVAGGTAGIVCVAAAGNESANNDTTASYPANYTSDAVISVAATDASNRLATFSNYGLTSVDVAAPGVAIYSTVPNGGYASYSGTSMATPHVAGTVALLAAANPRASVAQIRSAILSTAVPVAALAGKVATGGLVNAAAALAAFGGSEPPPPPPPPPPPSGVGEPNDSLAAATPLTITAGRGSVSAAIGDGAYGAADVDLYAITLAAGAGLTVDIDAATLSPSSSLDSYVRIFTSSGVQVAANDDFNGSLDSFVSYTATTAGTYYVGVSAYGNSSYSATAAGSGTAASSTGSYTAILTVTASAPTADVIDVSPDPRTTAVSAVVVQFSRAVAGVDAADFTLTRDGVAVSLAGVGVTTADGVRWTVSGLSAATGSAGSYVLTLNAAGSGITAVDGGTPLAASASDSWLTQAATLVDAGDTLATAADLGLTAGEVRLSGRVGDGAYGSRDVDMYRVVLAAGQTLEVDIDARTLSGGSTLDSYVRLFDGSGRQLASNDDSGGSFDSYLSVRANVAGTYYVGISGYGNGSYSATRAGSGRNGSTGVYQARFALSAASTAGAAPRIAGSRDAARPATVASAFALYGANWDAALPSVSADRSRRK